MPKNMTRAGSNGRGSAKESTSGARVRYAVVGLGHIAQLRAEPVEVTAMKARGCDKRFGEGEEAVSAILRFPDDSLAMFSCSFGASDVARYQVIGTKGSPELDPTFEYATDLKLKIAINGKSKEKVFAKSDQFAPELVYFSDCVLHTKEPEPGRERLADVRITLALYESLERRHPRSSDRAQPRKATQHKARNSPAGQCHSR